MIILINAIFPILAVLILIIPTAVELWLDHREYKNGKRDDKLGDVMARGINMSMLALIASFITNHSYLACLFLTFAIFFMFFDYIMGILLTGSPTFLGTTSQSDRFFKRIKPWKLFILRGLVFAAAVIVYINY